MDDKNQQTLNDIKNLQEIEKELYNTLEKDSASNQLTNQQKEAIINRINEISQMRINLYQNLNNSYSFIQDNVKNTQNTIAQQIMATNIVENELKEAKARLELLQKDKVDKLRLTQINTYYSKKYNAHKEVMKTIVYICIPILILAFIYNNGFLPGLIYAFLVTVILIIGFFSIGKQILDIINRDSMNYDEYDWYFDQSKYPTTTVTSSSTSNTWQTPTLTCIGSSCCTDGTTYDANLNKCVSTTCSANTSSNNVKEGMISDILSKYVYKDNSNIKPAPINYLTYSKF